MNIFDGIEKEKLTSILAGIQIERKAFKQGEIIANYHGDCASLIYVLKGEIKAFRSIGDSEETIKKINENEYIGLNLLFSTNPVYRAKFLAITDVEIEIISKEDLIKILMRNEDVLKNYLNEISDLAISQNDSNKIKTMKNIRTKICFFLYEEYKKEVKLEFTLKYSKTELAKMLNVERPSLGFEIKKLVDEGIIENKNRDYKILSLDLLIDNLK